VTAITDATAEYHRTVLPVVVDYVRHITHGADLARLKTAAQAAGAVAEVQLIDALIAASAALDGKPRWGTPADHSSEEAAGHRARVKAVTFNAITRITTEMDNAWVRLQARDAMAAAVLDDLAAQGYAITYVGGGA
jgi:hypothetical protein